MKLIHTIQVVVSIVRIMLLIDVTTIVFKKLNRVSCQQVISIKALTNIFRLFPANHLLRIVWEKDRQTQRCVTPWRFQLHRSGYLGNICLFIEVNKILITQWPTIFIPFRPICVKKIECWPKMAILGAKKGDINCQDGYNRVVYNYNITCIWGMMNSFKIDQHSIQLNSTKELSRHFHMA